MKNITITQIGKVRRDVSTWSDGSESLMWSFVESESSVWESNAEGKNVYVLLGGLSQQAKPKLLRFDKDSISWITEKSLDKQAIGSGGAVHYVAKVQVVAESGRGAPAITADYQAWIDPKTLMPLKFDDGDALYVLKFSKAPSGPLVMPEKIQAEMRRWQAATVPHPHL